ncbi:MAG: rhomboid family intramembrane serine protease [Halobacteriota archaeon]
MRGGVIGAVLELEHPRVWAAIGQSAPPSLAVPEWLPIHRLVLLFAIVGSLYLVYRLDAPRGSWGHALRSRFLLGVPWGTLTSMALVIGVYLFVQGGIDNLYGPTVIPFRAWSYFDPLGVVVSGFAHANFSHLRGNMVGTLALAPLAEYAFGHYPRSRGSSSFGSVRTNPYVRAFVIFPAGVGVVGLFAGVFSLGPSIGFSSVVYAFAGFALVFYPLGTVVALSARQVIQSLYFASRYPEQVSMAEPAYSTPWFAGTAVQGHALGLVLGVLLGIAVLRYRDSVPTSALRLWVGALVYAVSQSLWAIYWYRGEETYVLYRAFGLALVFALATIVAAAVAARDRPFVPELARSAPRSITESIRSATPQRVAMLALLLTASVLIGPTLPVSLNTADTGELPGEPIEIRGYEITYGEDVPDGMIGVVDVEAFGESTQVNTSGVIVRNTDRHIWATETTTGQLAFDGRSTVRVGGIGWQETVVVEREGWTATNSDTAYRISMQYADQRQVAYLSEPATAEPLIAGRDVIISAEADAFLITVSGEDERVTEPIPDAGENVTVGDLVIYHEQGALFAVHEESRTALRVADKERYGAEREQSVGN